MKPIQDKPHQKTHRLEIEAALERSLRAQVKAPRLAKSFDSGVWSRIDVAARPAVPASAAARWMFMLNGIGAGVALLMVMLFGGQWLMATSMEIEMPGFTMDGEMLQHIVKLSSIYITGGALAVGVMLTPLGGRIRNELREFF